MKHHYLLTLLFFEFISILIVPFSSAGQSATPMALGSRREINTDWIGYNAQNTIRDSIYFTSPRLIQSFSDLRPKIVRWPGGGVANWWDWKKGWFFVNHPECPDKYKDMDVLHNTLDSLKKVCDYTGATPIFVLNMVSSNIKYQMQMLLKAQQIGLPVKYVELGNEFYLDEEEDSTYIYSLFPDGATYGNIASEWIDSIHNRFPDVKVAAIGSFNRNNASRRVQWDTSMLRTLHGQDAISFHSYISAATIEGDGTIDTFTHSDVLNLLYRPQKMWNILTEEDFPLVPAGNEIWMTEYNLQDHKIPAHGTWGHGLFLGTQTMMYLNDPRIKHTACHAIGGTGVYGAYFNTMGGFHFGGGGDGTFVSAPEHLYDTTQLWGLTAGGRNLEVLGIAMENMTHVSPIEFPDIPLITALDKDDTVSYPAVYGWLFSNDTASHAIIVNLSGTEYSFKSKFVFPNGGTSVMYYADPVAYIDSEKNVTVSGKTSIPDNYKSVPYSISYLRSNTAPAPPPAVAISVNGSTTICTNDSVLLDAGPGYLEYLWSTGETTQTIRAKEAGNYSVSVRTSKNHYQAKDTVQISELPVPGKPKIQPPSQNAFCEGTTAELSVKNPSGTLSYSWSNGGSGLSTLISAGGNFTLMAMNTEGCVAVSDPAIITLYPMPHPTVSTPISPDGCFDVGITLSVNEDYNLYTWSNGKVGKQETFKETGTYTVTVKDNNGCFGTSFPAVLTIHEPGDPAITISGPTSFCAGSSPTYLKAINGYSYQWQKGQNSIGGATSKKYFPEESGTYKVMITDDWGCTKKSEGVSITVTAVPATGITIDGPKKICDGIEVTTLLAKDCSGCSFQWKKDDANISGADLPLLLVTYSGSYRYTVTDPNGCSSTSSVKTINSRSCRMSIEQEEASHYLSIYPNPSSGLVNIEAVLEASVAEISIINVFGEVVIHQSVVARDGLFSELWSSSLTNGIYLVRIKDETTVLTKTLIVAGSK